MPRVSPTLTWCDYLGTVGARTGLSRSRYTLAPGLYGLGDPGADSPVLVTANYKLSFDALRRQLTGIDAWLLVVDTRGINVWCAAGKKTFSTEEVAYQVKSSRLAEIVRHRELILPQLSAVGVAADKLRKSCGFSGIFGPIRAEDISAFLTGNKVADEAMRTVTFTVGERAVLVPVEICLMWKPLLLTIVAIFAVSGIGPDFYSFNAAGQRGLQALAASLAAILAGAVLTPLALPWIPVRQFWLKGAICGLLVGAFILAALDRTTGLLADLALLLWITSAASYLAMNFTGSTPFTSLSGVGVEMRRGLVFQISGAAMALILWIWSPFS